MFLQKLILILSILKWWCYLFIFIWSLLQRFLQFSDLHLIFLWLLSILIELGFQSTNLFLVFKFLNLDFLLQLWYFLRQCLIIVIIFLSTWIHPELQVSDFLIQCWYLLFLQLILLLCHLDLISQLLNLLPMSILMLLEIHSICFSFNLQLFG